MKQQIKTKMVLTKEVTVSITRDDLIELVASKGYTPMKGTCVFVEVPRGGDYSGEDLPINDDCPVFLTWTERSEEGGIE